MCSLQPLVTVEASYNVIALGQTKGDNIKRMRAVTGDFYLKPLVIGTFEMQSH